MVVKVFNVMCSFLGFSKTSSQKKANMMFILMFDPYFEGMNYIMDDIGRDQVTMFVQ
jgi:hypothetical protein